ncbi:MAG TPA: ferredoxin-thioredoxin reductase catalytic domain-containing protein [Sulfuricurvum sp.]|nr:ferredoxin-thioredoxin reductase catalytic domain-containing protein [Sulfuricurvum sp.]
MINMMIGFFKDFFKYRESAKKQQNWLEKYAKQKNYALNPSWMMLTNLKSNLCEMEATFGKRYCPCFEPSADEALNKKMMCPCKFIDDEIAQYGTCHCALFGPSNLSKAQWKASSKRLMDEYQVPKNLKNGVLDTRGMPLDPHRLLPIPDMMHQVKSTLNGYKGETLTVIVEHAQEVRNLEKIAEYRGLKLTSVDKNGSFEAVLDFRK